LNKRFSNPLKILIIVLLVAFSVFLTIWFHFVKKTEVLFPSIYYLPIILACLWWDRKGISLAVLFALLLLTSSVISSTSTPIWEDAIRATAFMLTAVVVAELSLRRKMMIVDLEVNANELKARNKQLDEYTRSASHDIIGPLATLHGFAEVSTEAVSTGDIDLLKESLHNIENLCERTMKTVETLLESARDGTIEGEVKWVHPTQIAEEVLFDLLGASKDQKIDIIIDEEMPVVLVDPLKLRQVFSNLIGNSIKHRGKEPLWVEIGGGKKNYTVTFYVRDNGSGIDDERLAKIFDPFERLDDDKRTPGYGLGLSIVKQTVEAWKGKVWVESVPGEGTTFFFTIPISK
jgi:signal transduction histidine kinase